MIGFFLFFPITGQNSSQCNIDIKDRYMFEPTCTTLLEAIKNDTNKVTITTSPSTFDMLQSVLDGVLPSEQHRLVVYI